jgi:16S rRNA processing protein RimM
MGGNGTVARYRRIAKVSHAKGLTGEVVAVSAGNLPFHVTRGRELWVVPPDHDLVRTTKVNSVIERNDGWLLSLEGVADRSCARRLVGRYLLALVDEDDQSASDSPTSPLTHFIGRAVYDGKAGFIGTIVEERAGAAQTLWIVEGPLGEILIPAVDAFIRSSDAKTVHVILPDGLLELNR